jgi:predicted DsbA family dithiol-disulfide isomerase
MRVDIWSDVVCPWCYVGKARFEKALAEFGYGDEVEVTFRSFELDPGAGAGGHEGPPWPPAWQMISKKFGLPMAQARQMEERVAGLAQAEGLRYQLERPNGNTFDLHRVLQLGREKGVQGDLIDAIYAANFADARPIFDPEVVTEVAVGAGLDKADVAKVLGTDEYADAVRADEDQARKLGISGVPYYVLDMRIGVSGAQSTETFTQALTQAWEHAQG